MPVLRRGVRRGRARIVHNHFEDPPRAGTYVKTRAAVAREAAEARPRPRTRLAIKELNKNQEDEVIVISERDTGFEDKKVQQLQEEEDKGAMGDESGGLSANKAAGIEEEGSSAPFPEKVCFFSDLRSRLVWLFSLFLVFHLFLIFVRFFFVGANCF